MNSKKVILIIDDDNVSRRLLANIFSGKYTVIEADNGDDAIAIIEKGDPQLDAVLLDLAMPVMDGFAFMERMAVIPDAASIPIIVFTGSENKESEIKAISMGAADYITKTSSYDMLSQRVEDVLSMFAASALKKQVERDPLTGLYNRNIFYHRVEMMLKASEEGRFAIVTMDIERFKLINDIYGLGEGDKLLTFVAERMLEEVFEGAICGRIGGDIFAALVPIEEGFEFSEHDFGGLLAAVREYPLNIDISLKLGVYYITDHNMSVNAMCDRARLANESIKGKYGVSFACYNDSLRESVLEEQQILNDMADALKQQQFYVYYQPKYDLVTEKVVGAEALVRWIHPEKGFISPGQFVPLFERNGFITELDTYVWDKVFANIRRWKDEGLTTVPISVNVSRVDIYKLKLDEIFSGLLEKYNLTADNIHLEITESAYTESPRQIIDMVNKLHNLGFHIEMDDFGTGYSSLNMLNELDLDTLKLDMKFLQGRADGERKNNILNFVISLAKWMNLKVVAEGVETREQMLFLRSMSCNIGQGYYFSKPLPQSEFEKIIRSGDIDQKNDSAEDISIISPSDIWNPISQFNTIFGCYIGALGIFEVSGDVISFVRGNDEFFRALNVARDNMNSRMVNISDYVEAEDRYSLMSCIKRACKEFAEVENYSRWNIPGSHGVRWMHIKIKLLSNTSGRSIIMAAVEDITDSKRLSDEIESHRQEIYRQHELLAKVYDTASWGMAHMRMEDLVYISANNAMVRMLGFDSIYEFLDEPRTLWDFVGDDCAPQVRERLPALINGECGSYISLEHGAVTNHGKRVWVQCLMQKMIYAGSETLRCIITDVSEVEKTAYELSEAAQRDTLTGLLTRDSLEKCVDEYLHGENAANSALMILDIDNFKDVNVIHGYDAGNRAICDVAKIVKGSLREGDLIARMGGDAFCVFMKNFAADVDVIEQRGNRLCELISQYKLGETRLYCSAGMAVCPAHADSFSDLYSCADAALYKAKHDGKNKAVMYDKGETIF